MELGQEGGGPASLSARDEQPPVPCCNNRSLLEGFERLARRRTGATILPGAHAHARKRPARRLWIRLLLTPLLCRKGRR